jgi:Bacterial regulatory proteins, tetR family
MAQPRLGEQLLVGASRVLYAKGYHASSVKDIVAVAGAPKGSGRGYWLTVRTRFASASTWRGKREIG